MSVSNSAPRELLFVKGQPVFIAQPYPRSTSQLGAVLHSRLLVSGTQFTHQCGICFVLTCFRVNGRTSHPSYPLSTKGIALSLHEIGEGGRALTVITPHQHQSYLRRSFESITREVGCSLSPSEPGPHLHPLQQEH